MKQTSPFFVPEEMGNSSFPDIEGTAWVLKTSVIKLDPPIIIIVIKIIIMIIENCCIALFSN